MPKPSRFMMGDFDHERAIQGLIRLSPDGERVEVETLVRLIESKCIDCDDEVAKQFWNEVSSPHFIARIKCFSEDGNIKATTLNSLLKYLEPPSSPSRRREVIYNARDTPSQKLVLEQILIPRKERKEFFMPKLHLIRKTPSNKTSHETKGKKPRTKDEIERSYNEWKQRKEEDLRREKEKSKTLGEPPRKPRKKEISFEMWKEAKAKLHKELLHKMKQQDLEIRRKREAFEQQKRTKVQAFRANIQRQRMKQRQLEKNNQVNARIMHTGKARRIVRGTPYLQKLANQPETKLTSNELLDMDLSYLSQEIPKFIPYKEFEKILKEGISATPAETITRMHTALRASGIQIDRDQVQIFVQSLPKQRNRLFNFKAIQEMWKSTPCRKRRLPKPERLVWGLLCTFAKQFASESKKCVVCTSAALFRQIECVISPEDLAEPKVEQAFDLCVHSFLVLRPSWPISSFVQYVEEAATSHTNIKNPDNIESKLFKFFLALPKVAKLEAVETKRFIVIVQHFSLGKHAYLRKIIEGSIWSKLFQEASSLSKLYGEGPKLMSRYFFVQFWIQVSNERARAKPKGTQSSQTIAKAGGQRKMLIPELEAVKSAIEAVQNIPQKELDIFLNRSLVPSRCGMLVLGCLCLILTKEPTLNTAESILRQFKTETATLWENAIAQEVSSTCRERVAQAVETKNIVVYIRKNEMAFFSRILRFLIAANDYWNSIGRKLELQHPTALRVEQDEQHKRIGRESVRLVESTLAQAISNLNH